MHVQCFGRADYLRRPLRARGLASAHIVRACCDALYFFQPQNTSKGPTKPQQDAVSQLCSVTKQKHGCSRGLRSRQLQQTIKELRALLGDLRVDRRLHVEVRFVYSRERGAVLGIYINVIRLRRSSALTRVCLPAAAGRRRPGGPNRHRRICTNAKTGCMSVRARPDRFRLRRDGSWALRRCWHRHGCTCCCVIR